MELKSLRVLVAIADHGNFSAAGNAIGLSQSAVSLHVKSLEEEFGTALFDKTRRPHVFNGHGSSLVKQAREILRNCAELKQSVSTHRYDGVLKLGAVPSVTTGVLPLALRAMQNDHPNLLVDLTSGLSGDLASRVYKGSLDVAIVSEPENLNTGLSWHPFVSESLMVIAPRSAGQNSDTDLLQAWPFIRFQRATWAGQLIDANLRERGVKVRSCMEMDSLEAIISMVAAGLGVSIVPLRPVPHPFPPEVKAVQFGTRPVHRVVGLIERISNPKTEFVMALHRILCLHCRGDDKPADC